MIQFFKKVCLEKKIYVYNSLCGGTEPSLLGDTKDIFTRLFLFDKELQVFENFYKILRVRRDEDIRISLKDLSTYFNKDRSLFLERFLRSFERSKNGRIDFDTFVITVWNFCTLDSEGLIRHLFHLYCTKSPDSLLADDLRSLMCDVYGDNFHEKEAVVDMLQNMLRLISEKDVPVMTLQEFKTAVPPAAMTVMLIPPTKLQNKLQKLILGVRFWKRCMNERQKLMKEGVHLNLAILLKELKQRRQPLQETATPKVPAPLQVKSSKDNLAPLLSDRGHAYLKTPLGSPRRKTSTLESSSGGSPKHSGTDSFAAAIESQSVTFKPDHLRSQKHVGLAVTKHVGFTEALTYLDDGSKKQHTSSKDTKRSSGTEFVQQIDFLRTPVVLISKRNPARSTMPKRQVKGRSKKYL